VIANSVVIGNLIYLIGAVSLMVVLSMIVVLRHRKPKSVEANMASFHRGLRALAPETPPRRASTAVPDRPAARVLQTQTLHDPGDGPTMEAPPG
jgi:hypothetical protein